MALLDEVRDLRAELQRANSLSVGFRAEINSLHDQLNSERGISATLNKQTEEINGLRKAAYWLAGLIVASSLGFAFSVLLLIP